MTSHRLQDAQRIEHARNGRTHAFVFLLLICALISGLISCRQREWPVALTYADVRSGKSLPYWIPQKIDLTALDSTGQSFKLPDSVRASALVAELPMGNSDQPVHLLLAKSDERSLYYNLLFVDRSKDGDFTNDGPPLHSQGIFMPNRNRHYTEFADVTIPYEWLLDETSTEEPFLGKIYFWYPDAGPPATATIVRDCWREGSFQHQKQAARVILVDDDCNGIYDTRDRWALFPADSLNDKFIATRALFREMTSLGWLGDTAFELQDIAPRGNHVLLRKKQVEMTREEDFSQDTPYVLESRRPIAARRIAWLQNYTLALRRARARKKPVLAYFSVSWSGPSVMLEKRTYTDAEVVALSDAFICLKIDSDRERKLVKKYAIQNYPTILILDARGREISRVVGYQPASELCRYLEQYARGAPPRK